MCCLLLLWSALQTCGDSCWEEASQCALLWVSVKAAVRFSIAGPPNNIQQATSACTTQGLSLSGCAVSMPCIIPTATEAPVSAEPASAVARLQDGMHQWLRDSKDLLQRHNKASPSEDVRAPSSSSQPSAAASGALDRPEHACLPFCSRLLLPINASLCNAALACCLCAVTRLASVRSVLSFMPLPEGPVSVSQRPRRVAACLLLSCTYEVGVCHPAASSL